MFLAHSHCTNSAKCSLYPFLFKKTHYYVYCMNMCMSMCGYMHMRAGAYGGQKRAADSIELEVIGV